MQEEEKETSRTPIPGVTTLAMARSPERGRSTLTSLDCRPNKLHDWTPKSSVVWSLNQLETTNKYDHGRENGRKCSIEYSTRKLSLNFK